MDFRELLPTFRSPDRATHLLHPYPAKLLCHIPCFFLGNDLFSRRGDTVLDPFVGSGTVALEAIMAGRNVIAADCNPFARLLTIVKTRAMDLRRLQKSADRLHSRIEKLPTADLPDVINLHRWFPPNVLSQLCSISASIEKTQSSECREFFQVVFSNCLKRVSTADPRLSVPVLLNPEKYPKSHHLRSVAQKHLKWLVEADVHAVFRHQLSLQIHRYSSAISRLNEGVLKHVYNDAIRLKRATGYSQPANSVQLTITSPPYPGAQKYIRSTSLSLGWLALSGADELIELKRQCIGREEFRKTEVQEYVQTKLSSANKALKALRAINPVRATIAATYLNEMESVIQELFRVTKPGGYVVLVSANSTICGTMFPTPAYLQEIAEDWGFRTILRLIDDIRSRGLMTKRNKTASIITQEWIHVFQKG